MSGPFLPGRRATLAMLAAAALGLRGLSRAAHAAAAEPAPEFAGLENWINSAPLTLASLRGKVVLVDFWTHGCGNCVATLPTLRAMDADLSGRGFQLVGVHTPEFPWEHGLRGVERAVARHGLEYPIAQDNRYLTWRAYRVNYWPTSVIVDREGRIVKYHEGDQGMNRLRADVEAMLAR